MPPSRWLCAGVWDGRRNGSCQFALPEVCREEWVPVRRVLGVFQDFPCVASGIKQIQAAQFRGGFNALVEQARSLSAHPHFICVKGKG